MHMYVYMCMCMCMLNNSRWRSLYKRATFGPSSGLKCMLLSVSIHGMGMHSTPAREARLARNKR